MASHRVNQPHTVNVVVGSPASGFCFDKSTLPVKSAINQAQDSNTTSLAHGKLNDALIFTLFPGGNSEIEMPTLSSHSATSGCICSFMSHNLLS
jgi:hypothetical protein